MKLAAYLNLKGKAGEAIEFYKDLLGAELSSLMRFSDAPGEMNFPKSLDNLIMHSTLEFGGETLHISDSMQEQLEMGNAYHLSLSAETAEEAHALFSGLSEAGKVTMELQEVFWGGIFGMCRDRYGVQWMISGPVGH